MKKSTFTDEQIIYALRQAEHGTTAAEVCRNLGISEQTCAQIRYCLSSGNLEVSGNGS